MKLQLLTISGIDLKNNKPLDMLLKASNPFMLSLKYQNFNHRCLFIKGWGLVNAQWKCGSDHPINAGFILHKTLEELTKSKLHLKTKNRLEHNSKKNDKIVLMYSHNATSGHTNVKLIVKSVKQVLKGKPNQKTKITFT